VHVVPTPAPTTTNMTTEQRGLQELSEIRDHGDALQVLLRLARTIRAEDDQRSRESAIEALDSTIVRLENDLTLHLSETERRRLLVRVMCELVAYGEVLEPSHQEPT
jgi:hypothetical protein